MLDFTILFQVQEITEINTKSSDNTYAMYNFCKAVDKSRIMEHSGNPVTLKKSNNYAKGK